VIAVSLLVSLRKNSMKTFRGDFNFFLEKLKNKEPFSVSRNNDGEMMILFDQFIDLRKKLNGEFLYDPKLEKSRLLREKLLESAQYKDDNYYVGIACRCCVNDANHAALKLITGLDDDHLTWGNIFVNGNYRNFVNQMVPLMSNYKVVMVVNEKAKISGLPFHDKIVRSYRVGTNAWDSDHDLIDRLTEWIKTENIENHLFLFAAGPFSNILIHNAHKVSNKNTYLDIGSTMDDMLNLGRTRGYLNGAETLNKICIW